MTRWGAAKAILILGAASGALLGGLALTPAASGGLIFAGGALANVGAGLAGNLLHEGIGDVTRRLRRLGGDSGLPRNQDLARALRHAHLDALKYLLAEQRAAARRDPSVYDAPMIELFTEAASRWIGVQKKRAEADDFVVLLSLPDAAQSLAEDLKALSPQGENLWFHLDRLAEDALLEELAYDLVSDKVVVPETFLSWIRGEMGASWQTVARELFHKTIKDNPRVLAAFIIEQTNAIRSTGEDTRQLVQAVSRMMTSMGDEIGGIRRTLEAAGDAARPVIEAGTPAEQFEAMSPPQFGDAVPSKTQFDRLEGLLNSHPVFSVEGISGSGKTYLVSSFLQSRASALKGRRVLWSDSADAPALRDLALRLPGFSTSAAVSDELLAKAVVLFLERNQLLLVLDDLHERDQHSFGLLIKAAAARPAPARLIVLSRRIVDAGDWLGHLERHFAQGLDEQGAATLTRRRLGRDLAAADVAELIRVTDGLPFAVALFCTLVRDHAQQPRQLLQGKLSVEDRTRSWCRRMVDLVDPADVALLRGLSHLDGPFRPALFAVIGSIVSPQGYEEGLARIRQWHLLRRDTPYRWSIHRLLGDYCLAGADPAESRRIQMALGRYFSRGGKKPQTRRDREVRLQDLQTASKYFLAAGDRPKALQAMADMGADAKLLGAHRILIDLLTPNLGERPPESWPVYHLAHCLQITGHAPQSLRLLESTTPARGVSPELAIGLRRLKIEALCETGNLDEAARVAEEVGRENLAARVNATSRRQYWGALLNLAVLRKSPEQAKTILGRIVEDAPRGDRQDVRSSGVLQMQLSLVARCENRFGPALTHATAALEDFAAVHDQRGIQWASLQMSMCEIDLGQVSVGVSRIARIVASNARLGFDTQFYFRAVQHACAGAEGAHLSMLRKEISRVEAKLSGRL